MDIIRTSVTHIPVKDARGEDAAEEKVEEEEEEVEEEVDLGGGGY